MNREEYIEFLKSLLIKIENANNLLNQDTPKHIPSYHKMLGVQQKLGGLDQSYKNILFSNIVITRSAISYLMNGRYEDAANQIKKLKINMTKIYSEIVKNENNKV